MTHGQQNIKQLAVFIWILSQAMLLQFFLSKFHTVAVQDFHFMTHK
jgi:hypothetical protein